VLVYTPPDVAASPMGSCRVYNILKLFVPLHKGMKVGRLLMSYLKQVLDIERQKIC
jgi:hypothetical protein